MRCKFCGQEMEKTMIGEHYNFRDCANYLKAELARRDEIIARLKEDGERLAKKPKYERYLGCYYCLYCDDIGVEIEEVAHAPDCPITLHRALMKELEEK